MIVWRLVDARYARDLSGTGAKLMGGRWNDPGHNVLYGSEHLSLAALETIVHAPRLVQDRFMGRLALQISIPDSIKPKEIASLPRALSGEALRRWCRSQGNAWIVEAKALVLRVPSVVVREEFNYVVNCAHSDMKHVRIKSVRSFTFDERLFG